MPKQKTKRKKKYEFIKDLYLCLDIDILKVLEKDYSCSGGLVKHYYTVTTSGGKGFLWQVHFKEGTEYTVSTDALTTKTIRTGRGWVRIEPCGHYVLSEKGMRYIKDQLVEQLI